ncbi:MAG: hypothetical protein NW214_04185 [Pseudanabaenaceae cyanobacterium bins.39]|nr:hypothetical protein [Pseudanabaenaceae cyanobacterium bins.39]
MSLLEIRPHHTQRVQRLSLVLPRDVADEICDLPTCSKARLLGELSEEVLEQIEQYPSLMLSATTTQWLKSLTLSQTCQVLENLALMLINEVSQ